MRQHYHYTPISSADGVRQFIVDFAGSFPVGDSAPIRPTWPTSAHELVVACPLAHARDTCVCNNRPAPCSSCRDGGTCGCPVEVEVEFGRLIDGGFRIVRMPDGCPLNDGQQYTKAERAELMKRVTAAWAHVDWTRPSIGDDEDRAHTAQWHRHLASPDDN